MLDTRRILQLPPRRLALLALELQAQLERERGARAEPIAVVGMACRLPGGVSSTDTLWHLLHEGRDVIVTVPPDRWPADEYYDPDPDAPGKLASRWGGFLDDVARFDAGFFSISPREARSMDPQQRLLLETSWRAFEDAAIDPRRWRGHRAGVFVGLSANDYLARLRTEGLEAIDVYLATGNAFSAASGRLSFTYGFQGPAVSVDTACSASLVAVHLACQSLRAGECGLALAGGANVLCAPETAISLSRAHAMAPDGRCRTFDDSANGYVRAEGCGVVLLKRLSDALAAGDRIHAVLRGSAVGQDGRSGGLTVPSGPAQEQVIRDALETAGLQPGEVDYVEAHGTGTSLGDPIEVGALARVFGPAREHPLLLGSIKTNMGHLEAAAGVAGLIKTILSVREGRIPAHLHFQTPSTRIDWDACPMEVPTVERAWPATGRARRAGVSSFGFAGTNAHVIVEQAPDGGFPQRTADAAEPTPDLLVVSGFTPEALDAACRNYAAALPDGRVNFHDFCHTARAGRSPLGWRRALVAASGAEARAALRGAPGAPRLIESRGRVADPPPIAFLFTGQGAQHPGMGRALYESCPVFRAAIERCAAVLDPVLPLPLTRVIFEGADETAPIYCTALAQPAVVAFEWSLAELWRSWGVIPAAVLGHSLGEFVAATVAGVLEMEDMLRLVATRGRLLESLPPGDRVAAVFADAALVEELVRADGGEVAIGAYNGPENTMLSGRADAVDRIVRACAERGIEARQLHLDRGFHSSCVQPILDELQAAAAPIVHRAPVLPLPWNVTGEAGRRPPPEGYWREHARRPVRFAQGVRALAGLGIRHFLEVGPHPTLSPLVGQILEEEAPLLVPSLRRDADPRLALREAVGELWAAGAELDWDAFAAPANVRRIAIPVHPFAGDRYWVDVASFSGSAVTNAADPATWHRTPVWRERALGPAGFGEAAPARAAEAVRRAWPGIATQAGLEGYLSALPGLAARAAGHAWRALRELGLASAASSLPGVDELAEQLGIAPVHRRLLARLLEILAEHGYLEGDPAKGYHVVPGAGARPGHPEEDGSLAPAVVRELLDRCGSALPQVLRGRTDPVTLLFPSSEEGPTRLIYRDTPFGRAFNEAVRVAAAALVEERTDPVPLRVLEVGAGSGSTAEAILNALADRPIDYRFTDVSPTLVARAAERFQGRAGLSFHTLDVESDPAMQGVAPGSQDLIVAANVLHATADLADSVDWLRSALAPGGVLLLLEATTPEPWIDLTFGLTSGWWRFQDVLRRGAHPLLDAPAWMELLRGRGFTDVRAAPATGGEAVIVARRADVAPRVASPRESAALGAALGAAGHAPAGPDGPSVWVWEGDAADRGHLLGTMREIARVGRGARLWLVTHGAQSPRTGDRIDAGGAILWGLARVFALENPDLWGGILDLPAGMRADERAAVLLQALRSGGEEDQLAWRDGTFYVPRLVARLLPAAPRRRLAEGSYLVAGGLGGLGLKVALWLAERGARQLLLIGRTARPDSWAEDDPRRQALRRLEQNGVRILIRALNVTDREALGALLAEVRGSGLPLRGVVHAATVTESSPVLELSQEALDATLAPKVEGTLNLAELTRADPLDFFVLFSSLASVLGAANMGAYAAANQFQDSFAEQARAQGIPALSVNWGMWDETRLASAALKDEFERVGLRKMRGRLALEGLERLIARGAVRAVMADADWERFKALFEARRPRPMLSELGSAATMPDVTARSPEAGAQPVQPNLAASLAGLPRVARGERLAELVEATARDVLRLAADRRLDPGQGFFEMGMDSLMSLELKNRLEQRLGVRLPATLTFNHPNVTAVASFLDGRLAPAPGARPGGEPAGAPEAGRAASPADARQEDEAGGSAEALGRELGDRLARLEREGLRPEASSL